jgi:hypothetical protein
VAGGGRVHDHQVVARGAARAALHLRELPDLAHRHQLAHARRRHGEVLEHARPGQHVGERLHPDLDAQVLLQRVLRVDRDRPQVVGDLDLAEVRVLPVEGAGDPVLVGDLGDDGPAALAGGHHAQRRGDRGLADAPLSGHEDQALVEEGGHRRRKRL